jgi:hypothetical protein
MKGKEIIRDTKREKFREKDIQKDCRNKYNSIKRNIKINK